jgi:hypothetical protein
MSLYGMILPFTSKGQITLSNWFPHVLVSLQLQYVSGIESSTPSDGHSPVYIVLGVSTLKRK